MKKPCASESQEQSALIQWWRMFCKTKSLDERLLFSIPNGSNKSPAAAMKFQREGLRKGVPDLFLSTHRLAYKTPPVCRHHGLYIELKRIRGSTTSPEQLEMHTLLRAQGYRVEICKGAAAAIGVIEEYLS